MIDTTFMAVIVGFIALVFTVLWSERRLDKRFDRQDERLDKRFDRQDERFDKQDERFDKQDERLSAIELGQVQMRAELEAIRERLDRQDERFDRHDERFDRQDESFDRQDERLAAIELGLAEIRTELKTLNERVDKHDEQFDDLRGEMKLLNSKVGWMQGSLDVIVFGDRGVPPPVAREREELEQRLEEPVGD